MSSYSGGISPNSRSKGRIKYCRECGAEVYSNEKKCWNCGAKTTDRKIQCRVAWVLCAIFFLALGSGTSSSESSTSEVIVSKSEGTKDVDTTKTSDVLEVDALDLVALFNENQASYSKKYSGKKIRTRGKISSIIVDAIDESEFSVTIETGYKDMFSSSLRCVLSGDGVGKIDSYSEGDMITVQGVAEVGLFDATLNNCDIVE